MANGIIETITNNWILSIGLAALIIYAVWDFVKRKKAKKKEKEVLRKKIEEAERRQEDEARMNAIRMQRQEAQRRYEPEYEEIRAEPKVENKNLHTYFTDKKEDSSKDKTLGFRDYSSQIASSKKDIEQKIKEEKEQLKKELEETSKKKEELRKHGLALAELFDKYAEREEQLKNILNK